MNAFSRLKIIQIIIVVGFAFSVFYHYALGNYLGLNFYPFNTFLFMPQDVFMDFCNLYPWVKAFNPYGYPYSNYFPFTFILLYPFTLLGAAWAFALFAAVFVMGFCFYVYKNISLQDKLDRFLAFFSFSFLTYPFLFALDRGNVEIYVFLLLALFIYYYQKGQTLKSLAFLSFATAMKAYPAVFLILFLKDKKYKELFITIVLVLFLTVFSAALFKGGVGQTFSSMLKIFVGLGPALDSFQQVIRSCVGLFGLFKLFIYGLFLVFPRFFMVSIVPNQGAIAEVAFGPFARVTLQLFYLVYPVFALLFFLVLVIFIFRRQPPFWQIVALLVFSMLLLPQISGDYKLLHVFIPMFLFINCKSPNRYDPAYAILFGLLLIPKDYYVIVSQITIAVVLNPLIMLAMLILIIREQRRAPHEVN